MQASMPEREVVPSDVKVPSGFQVDVITTRLSSPVKMALAPNGDIYVAEMGSMTGETIRPGRIVRVRSDGSVTETASGFQGTLTAVAFRDGLVYVGENRWPGHIIRIESNGSKTTLIDGLPAGGDHPINGITFGPDGRMYFGQGTVTNSGIIGTDNLRAGWLSKYPNAHDIPGQDLIVAGQNVITSNPLSTVSGEQAETGAFVPFGTLTSDDMKIRGSHKCNGSILRAHHDGSNIEVVAWGLRETFGLAFDRDGLLFCTENGMEERGSRPIHGDTDRVWEVRMGAWYGWPDFAGGKPATDLHRAHGPEPKFLIRDHPPLDGPPRLRFPSLAGTGGLAFAPAGNFGYEGQAFIAVAGNHAPHVPMLNASMMEPQIVCADLRTGQMTPFAINEHAGTASSTGRGGLERPVDVAFDTSGETLFILDYGQVETTTAGIRSVENTGVLWRMRRPRIYTTGFR